MDKPVVLENEKGLVNKDLSSAYKACSQGLPEMPARFKKKEELGGMARSILKHRIQTLTGKQIKQIEEEMKYKPKDPNELGMNVDTMRALAHYLILLSNEIDFTVPASREASPAPEAPSRKRRSSSDLSSAVETETVKKPKTSRRSMATPVSTPTVVPRSGRRSIAVSSLSESLSSGVNGSSSSSRSSRGSEMVAASKRNGSVTSSKDTPSTPVRNGRRSVAGTPNRADVSSTSDISQAVRCLGPATKENLLNTVQEDDNDEDGGVANPTPLMKEMIKKRQSMGGKLTPAKSTKQPAKLKELTPEPKVTSAPPKPKNATPPAKVATPPAPKVKTPPAPRQEFSGHHDSSVYLLAGDPLSLTHRKVVASLPLAAGFPGANLAVVHTPAEWTPHQMFQIAQIVKKMNREAGLQSFVFMAGTGLSNVHLNQEALLRHTKHVQFVSFHREDANKEFETGKLRETTSFFLVAYFFPGCDGENSTLPEKMVRDGYTTCFRTESASHLEKSIVDCFSEAGEWVMDICCGTRKITYQASQQGRSAVAVHADADALEELGNYLRTAAIKADTTFRDVDGLVVNLA